MDRWMDGWMDGWIYIVFGSIIMEVDGASFDVVLLVLVATSSLPYDTPVLYMISGWYERRHATPRHKRQDHVDIINQKNYK